MVQTLESFSKYISYSAVLLASLSIARWVAAETLRSSSFERNYSHSTSLFSPSGRIPQIEFAGRAVLNGALSIGLVYCDGVILSSARILQSSLINCVCTEKIAEISERCFITYSGLSPDFRFLYDCALNFCSEYCVEYGSDASVPVERVVFHIASKMQEYTQTSGVRPFGTSLMVGSVHSENSDVQHKLFLVDPSGHHSKWFACAIGKNSVDTMMDMKQGYVKEMTYDEAMTFLHDLTAAAMKRDNTIASFATTIITGADVFKKDLHKLQSA